MFGQLTSKLRCKMFRLILVLMLITGHYASSDCILDALNILRDENQQDISTSTNKTGSNSDNDKQQDRATITTNKTESISEYETVTIKNESESTYLNQIDQINNRNKFGKLYVQLKEYHEKRIKMFQQEYDILKEKFLTTSAENLRLKSSNCNLGSINLNVSCHIPNDKINANDDNNTLLNSLALKVNEIHKLLTTKVITKASENQYIDASVGKERTRGKYLGCFQDNYTHRLMKGYIKRMKFNHVELCVDLCRKGNFVYAGLAKEWCFCDNTLLSENKYNYKLTDTYCDTPCVGKRSQMCGRSFANSVYETGIEQYLMNEEGKQLGESYLEQSPNNYFIVGGSFQMDD